MLINPNPNFPENFTKARYHVVIYLPSSSEFKVKHGLRRNQIQIKLNKIRRRLLAVENIFLKTQYWNNLTFCVKTKSIKYTSSLRWLSSVILFPHKKSQNIYMMTCILHTQVHDLTVLFLKRTWHHSYSTWIKVQYIFHSSHFPLPAAGMRGRWWAARGWWRQPPPGRSQRTPTPDWKLEIRHKLGSNMLTNLKWWWCFTPWICWHISVFSLLSQLWSARSLFSYWISQEAPWWH